MMDNNDKKLTMEERTSILWDVVFGTKRGQTLDRGLVWRIRHIERLVTWIAFLSLISAIRSLGIPIEDITKQIVSLSVALFTGAAGDLR